MKFCQKCGAQIDDDAIFCSNCGFSSQMPGMSPQPQQYYVDDSVSIGFVILSFVFPIFGWIYSGVRSKERPRCAKICGIVATVSWILGMLMMYAQS